MQRNIYNVGEIALRKDECFWIFDIAYLKNKEYNIYSPWFSCLGEKWRLVKEPCIENISHRFNGSSCTYLQLPFILRRKICSNVLKHKYTIQISLILKYGNDSIKSDGVIDSDYGSQLQFPSTLETEIFSKNKLVKLFFNIQREENKNTDKESSGKKVSSKVEENSDDKENSDDTENSDDEENSENDENSKDEESGEDVANGDNENSGKIKTIVSGNKGIKKLVENFKQVFLDERVTDAVLKVDNREFKVHKVVLVARSPVFASMFEHDLAEKNTNVVDIPDCTAESFEVFLYYLYSGSAETLSASNVYNVYYAADKYRVDDLKELCVKFMKINLSVETFCDTIALSLQHGESKLQKAAICFFCKNMKKVIKTVQWQQYMDENTTQANELFIKALEA